MGSQGPHLSNALRIANVNDFLAPTTSCVLPVGGGAVPRPAPAGSVLAPIVPSTTPAAGAPVATVTVSDCLACSGCVTSAETVLLSSENLEKVRVFSKRRLDGSRDHFAIASLSQQSVASIAVRYNLSLTDAAERLSFFFKNFLAMDAVVDMSTATQISLREAAAEFLLRRREGKLLTITSACPGWVTYAEKTQDAKVLNCISSIRSPQGIMGSIVSGMRSTQDKRPLWILSVAQCHDKKLEAIRPELTIPGEHGFAEREIACVLTTSEVVQLIEEENFNFAAKERAALNNVIDGSASAKEFGMNFGSGSDGYADFILRVAAKETLGVDLPAGKVLFEKASKSGDLCDATITSADGSRMLRFATAYGFRSLQSILRKVRAGTCPYDYIELMACPGGCNNGGGQLPSSLNVDESDERTAKQLSEEHLRAVNERFYQAKGLDDEQGSNDMDAVYGQLLGGAVGSEQARRRTRMQVLSRKESGVGSLEW